MTAHAVPRRTLAASASLSGTGLFTSQPATITFKPGSSGLTLSRAGLSSPLPVHHIAVSTTPIHPGFADGPPRSTNLAAGDTMIATVEHALSALAGLGITDCDIELQGAEVPILDGSAQPFVDAILEAGTNDLGSTIEPITIDEPITLKVEDRTITAKPRTLPGWSITYFLDYGDGAYLEPQAVTWDGSPETYTQNIARARTFCMEHEALALQSAGLFQGLTPADMLVIGKDGPIDNAYRLDNEPAAHKLLDATGDLTLAGRPIQADIVATKSGHALNHQMARALAGALKTQPRV
ncbi:MAG: UDP-3-O-acyl-N-acetylglucosamine deacetylase [Phycisphaera sp.]|nr:MAG: UDP-3-O-acyl-N-acetylglucosamine deacetylase [Phycisphaera sp.]